MGKKNRHIAKALISFLFVLLLMPLGHALMIIMEKVLPTSFLHTASFIMGFFGILLVIWGVFVKKDLTQTILGLIGGLLFWTGWVEFLFQYYAQRHQVVPEIVNGEVVTKPEYLILPASFGFWAMIMLMYLFSAKTGCNFINWCQKAIFRKQKTKIVAHPMTRHVSVITFMELNMILWTSYLLLMFCYDPHFLGDHHPLTFIIGGICFLSALLMLIRQTRIASWGHNIRFSIATVIIFWTPVEILGRIDFFKEIWVHPLDYKMPMIVIFLTFMVAGAFILFWSRRKSSR